MFARKLPESKPKYWTYFGSFISISLFYCPFSETNPNLSHILIYSRGSKVAIPKSVELKNITFPGNGILRKA